MNIGDVDICIMLLSVVVFCVVCVNVCVLVLRCVVCLVRCSFLLVGG